MAQNGDALLSNWTDDSFAVVSTGAPGVAVLNKNRAVGITESRRDTDTDVKLLSGWLPRHASISSLAKTSFCALLRT